MKLLSIVIPCFNEEEVIPFYYDEMTKTLKDFKEKYPDVEIEMIYVDDGSRDRTLSLIKSYAEKDERVRYVSFSRNFGKEAALYAGFENSKGDYVVCMDVDLQDPPALLIEMYEAVAIEGYDSAATRRVTRKGEPPIRSFFARRFYRLMDKICTTEVVDGARDYRIMTRQMTDAVLSMGDYNRFTKGIYGWVGFKTKWLEFENIERVAGETKWSFWNLLIYAIEGIIAFSTVPLEIIVWIGGVLSFLSAVFCIVALVLLQMNVWDMMPVIIGVIAFFGSVNIFAVGIASQYLSKAYLETKNRPLYIAKEKT
ncbi:MAG: glycosyltransferase family 2 protein [Lachnospiraceae bacterium]|nr:glycosyltransferase family 2 protein [Lachnospiraceae bacterium]MCR5023424.1 glycosyltransferase family 2 protein [Lachnospiraceae bacterium]